MTLGLDLKFSSPMSAKKEKEDDASIRSSQPAREEFQDGEEAGVPMYGGFSQLQPHNRHHEQREEEFFVPPTQHQSSSTSLQLRHTEQKDRKLLDEKRPRVKEEDDNDLLSEPMVRNKRTRYQFSRERTTARVEPCDSQAVLVGCTPGPRQHSVSRAGSSAESEQNFGKELGVTDVHIRGKEVTMMSRDGPVEEEDDKEGSEGSGHSAIIQQFLEKSQLVNSAQVRLR